MFRHSEDKDYHIYRLRSRAIAILYWVLTVVSFLSASFIYNIKREVSIAIYPFLLFLMLVFGGLIDMIPTHYRRMAAFYGGRNVISQGNWLFKNNWELKLEKKK